MTKDVLVWNGRVADPAPAERQPAAGTGSARDRAEPPGAGRPLPRVAADDRHLATRAGAGVSPAPYSWPVAAAEAPSTPATSSGTDAERCLRCGAAMEWRHQTLQCPRCRFKVGCCEGATGDCRPR